MHQPHPLPTNSYCSVDRKKSLQVLNAFLDERETLITQEVKWLKEQDIHCVLSDAVFIAW